MTSPSGRRILYVIACGSPVARNISHLVTLAHHDGWDVCVIATPDGRKFVDVTALARQTGHPVRTYYKNPGDPDVLPPADAMIVAPATVNTVNKWAAGIADTLALGLLVEGQGRGLPIVAIPYTNEAMAAHPALLASLERLRSWGIAVLFGDDVVRLHPPGTGERYLHAFPWGLALDALRAMKPANGHGVA
jgi:phosphopantothenoylcysteine synthetase/decarboxylase